MPHIDHLLASLSGGTLFSKLELAHAYMQFHFEEKSKKLTTINTEKGLYRYNCLPFGIAAATSFFQRIIENILHRMNNVVVYIDGVLSMGLTEEGHLDNLQAVLSQSEKAGLHLKHHKYAFIMKTVEYLEHTISQEGLRLNSKRSKHPQQLLHRLMFHS